MDIQQIKQRFSIIGNHPMLNRALEIAMQVAPTDISVLVRGESGTGKEIMPQVIHHLSNKKHGSYIAVNCGAIPEGTIDSELFGHEKGSFTGAHDSRKGYFEVADGGTIFLDEVAELPLSTQVRLLRVLETGEFIRVGSSKVIKTSVRIIAATNENMDIAIRKGKFREDLFYRLSTVPIHLPPLRDRTNDIHLLFRKFAIDFSDKYRMPTIKLSPQAKTILESYQWSGNIRQLKNVTEQISVIEKERDITREILERYLPVDSTSKLPINTSSTANADSQDLGLVYNLIFDLRKEVDELKQIVASLINGQPTNMAPITTDRPLLLGSPDTEQQEATPSAPYQIETVYASDFDQEEHELDQDHEEVEESLSLERKEKELISRALKKHLGRRKHAAKELGISERTLYRKIKEYQITE